MDILKGVRIISFNHFLMGPLGIQLLADLGADVITVEPPGGAFQRKWGGVGSRTLGGHTMLYLAANRNKRSMVLDLKKPAAVEIARRLIAGADVVAENYRPGVMDKLGLGYDVLKADHPGLIYAAGSGFGPTGPYAKRPGQDLIVQAMSGLAAITGREGAARAVGVSAVDHHGAALLAFAIAAALFGRTQTGRGRRIDVNLLSASLSLQTESLTSYLNGGRPDSVRQPEHLSGWYFPPPYGIYATSDGEIALSLGDLQTLCKALEIDDPGPLSEAEAYDQREALAARVAGAVAGKTTAEWVAVFTELAIWHSPVQDYAEVVADPQVRHNRALQTTHGTDGTEFTLVAHPVMYDGEVPGVRMAPQPLGAQSREILREHDYDDEAISRFEADGVVNRDQEQ